MTAQRESEAMTPADWIDQEAARRARGERTALTQSQHAAVNARYPGLTVQTCADCGEPTGRCEEDAMYVDDHGPLCEECLGVAEQGGAAP